ncbi:hypothetical protein HK101_001518 [Irineochytrium annulatum]|nr:hypothetical protein HK101_001518 [Irineochytrium annulatum]
MVPAIDKSTDAITEKKPAAHAEKTVEDLLALAKNGVFPKEAECIYRLPAYRNAWRNLVFGLAASGATPSGIENLVKTGGLSLMERDSDNKTILIVAAIHQRRELCDYLLRSSEGRALFFDVDGPEDTQPEDDVKKLLAEYKRRANGEGARDVDGEDTAFEPDIIPAEHLMRMNNPVLLELFLDNIYRYKWAVDCFIHALRPILDRCLRTVEERVNECELIIIMSSITEVMGGTNDDDNKLSRVKNLTEMLKRLASKLRATIRLMTVVNLHRASQIPRDERGFYFPLPIDLAERPWDEGERAVLASTAGGFARKAEDRDLLEWVLDDWGVDLGVEVPTVMAMSGYSVADQVVLGHRGVSKVEELMVQHAREPAGGEMMHRRAFFEKVVVDKWDGDVGTLMNTFKAAYEEGCKDEEGKVDGWTLNRNAAVHSDEGWEERLDRIKMLMGRMNEGACGRFPRLDLLTLAGEVNILRWLRAENFVDLSTQLYPVQDVDRKTAKHTLMASDADGDEDDCTVCFKKKDEPQMMDCKHSFCKACVLNIYDHVDTIPAACPLCRRAFPPLPRAKQTPVTVLAGVLKRCYPTLCSSATVGDALFFIAAWEGNVAVVAYLVDECGVDPSKVRTSAGMTAAHVACMLGRVAVARWLRSRDASLFENPTFTGDDDDADDDAAATPIDVLLASDKPHTVDIVRDFTRRGWLPHSWLELGRSSPNAQIARYAAEVGMGMSLLMIANALGNVETPLEVIVGEIEDQCLEDPPASLNSFIAGVYKAAVAAGRYDALRWIAKERGRWWDVMAPSILAERERRAGDKAFMDFCADVAVEITENTTPM